MYKKATGVIGEGWYDLNEKDIKCPQCGDLLTNSQVSRGTTCCCRSCTNQYRYANDPEFREKFKKTMKDFNDKNWANPEYREKHAERLREQAYLNNTDPVRIQHHRDAMKKLSESICKEKLITTDTNFRIPVKRSHKYVLNPIYKEYQRTSMIERNKDYEYQAKCKRGHFISRHKDKTDDAYFYYASISENYDVYKIGATIDMVNRNWRFSGYSKYSYEYVPILLATNTINNIAELEYQVKINFCIRDFELGTEFIPKEKLDEVIEFVKNFNYN